MTDSDLESIQITICQRFYIFEILFFLISISLNHHVTEKQFYLNHILFDLNCYRFWLGKFEFLFGTITSEIKSKRIYSNHSKNAYSKDMFSLGYQIEKYLYTVKNIGKFSYYVLGSFSWILTL